MGSPHGAFIATTRRGTGPPQVLEAQGVVGRSRQVGPIRTAYDSSIRITMRGTGGTSVAQHVSSMFDPSMTWDDVARIRDLWQGPIVIKGVLHPDDAKRAIEIGASAVVVSKPRLV